MNTRQFSRAVTMKPGQTYREVIEAVESMHGLHVRDWSVDGMRVWYDLSDRPSMKHLVCDTAIQTFIMLTKNYLRPCEHCGEKHPYLMDRDTWITYPYNEKDQTFGRIKKASPKIVQTTCKGVSVWKFPKEVTIAQTEEEFKASTRDLDEIPF